MTKEETKKLTRETRRDIVNIVMVVISCILYCLLIYGMVLMFRQFSTMVSSMNDYISCVDDAADVSDASAFLTDQVHHYVVEREPGHLEAYFVEANETKRRESALENLEEFADKETISSMQKALDYSNELMKTEIYAMRLIVESRGEDVSEFPQEVQDVRLLEEDQKLSSEEKAGKAVHWYLMRNTIRQERI